MKDAKNFFVQACVSFGRDAGVCLPGGVLANGVRGPRSADLDGDWRISISEMTAYVAGWRRAENPINYAMRAVYSWRCGENYIYDPDREGVESWRPAEP